MQIKLVYIPTLVFKLFLWLLIFLFCRGFFYVQYFPLNEHPKTTPPHFGIYSPIRTPKQAARPPKDPIMGEGVQLWVVKLFFLALRGPSMGVPVLGDPIKGGTQTDANKESMVNGNIRP